MVTMHRARVAFIPGIHRATIALRLRLTTLMLATVLTIHGRTAEALPPTLLRIAIASAGRIHEARSAILRGIHRTTLPIALRLHALTLDSHFRAALRLTHVVRTGAIAIPALVRTRLVAPCRSRRCVGFGNCGKRLRRCSGRLICRLGFLSLQGNYAESERTTKPGESVGFGFHESAV